MGNIKRRLSELEKVLHKDTDYIYPKLTDEQVQFLANKIGQYADDGTLLDRLESNRVKKGTEREQKARARLLEVIIDGEKNKEVRTSRRR